MAKSLVGRTNERVDFGTFSTADASKFTGNYNGWIPARDTFEGNLCLLPDSYYFEARNLNYDDAVKALLTLDDSADSHIRKYSEEHGAFIIVAGRYQGETFFSA